VRLTPEPPDPEKPKPPSGSAATQCFDVLIVDDEPGVREVLGDALRSDRLKLHEAGSIAEARQVVEGSKIDLVLVDVKLPDGSGLDLAGELRQDKPGLRSIVITGGPDLDGAVQAIRAGACDFLAKPLDINRLRVVVDDALEQRGRETRRRRQVKRLKRLCRRLNQSRSEVTQQVDVLCNDLVAAYQELADQIKHVETSTRFRTMIDQELDLEQLLRTILEYVLHQAGPTNAAIFLPGQGGGHTMGGYVNYSFERSSAEVLLQYLADSAAPRIAQEQEPRHLTDDAEINLWLMDESSWLSGMHVVTIPCRHEDEALAGLLLFRDASEPFDPEAIERINCVASVFAAHLVKVIDIHHRHTEFFEDEENDEGTGAF